MKSFHLLLVLLCISAQSLAQSAEELMKVADDYGYQQLDSATLYWERAADQAMLENNIDLAVQGYDKAGGSYLVLDLHVKAVEVFEKLYAIARNDAEKLNAMNGLTYRYLYDSEYGPDSLFKATIALATLVKDTSHIVSNLGNYAVYLQRVGRLQEAVLCFLESLAVGGAPLQRLTVCVNLAKLFETLNNEGRAKEYIDTAIEIAEKNNYKVRYQRIAVLEGAYLLRKEQLDNAEAVFQEILDKNKNNINLSTVDALIYLAMIRLRQGKTDEAQTFLNRSKSVRHTDESVAVSRRDFVQSRIYMANGLGNKAVQLTQEVLTRSENSHVPAQVEEAHRLLADFYESQGDAARALYHYKEFKKVESSLFQTNQSLEIFAQEGKYKRKEQENAIRLLDQQNQIQSFKLKEKNQVIIFGGIGLLIFSVLSFFLYRLFQKVRQQRNIIKSSLDEKEILLREIHHRVKNNLQMVSSLLSLQSRYIKDEVALEAIQQSKSRVRTMALIHQDLYTHDNLKSIAVQDYLKRLCAGLFNAYKIPSGVIELKLEIEDLELDVDMMISVGLILNELVANALKYAFPNDKEGIIAIEFGRAGNELVLAVSDNGVGFDYDEVADKSFGFKLIHTLVKRMKGEVRVHRDGGSRVEVRMRG